MPSTHIEVSILLKNLFIYSTIHQFYLKSGKEFQQKGKCHIWLNLLESPKPNNFPIVYHFASTYKQFQ